MVFKNVSLLVTTAICVILGFFFNKSTPIEMGAVMEKALSSFLALIGFIIMLGRGLGEVLTETKVGHNLVHISIVTLTVSWIMAKRFQRQYAKDQFEESDTQAQQFIPNKRQNINTWFFS